MNKLRKVRFSQLKWEMCLNEKEQGELNNLAKERDGYFHCWTEEIDESKSIPYIKKMALIEDCLTGKLHKVEYNLIKFLE